MTACGPRAGGRPAAAPGKPGVTAAGVPALPSAGGRPGRAAAGARGAGAPGGREARWPPAFPLGLGVPFAGRCWCASRGQVGEAGRAGA